MISKLLEQKPLGGGLWQGQGRGTPSVKRHCLARKYARDGVHVLWLLPWTAKLDAERYAPTIWEKWIHAAYFGRVYYWTSGLSVVPYRFEESFSIVPRKSWYSKRGQKITAGGYAWKSERYRRPVRGATLNLATDFVPHERHWWEGGGIKVPDAKLFIGRDALRQNQRSPRFENADSVSILPEESGN